MENKWEMFYDGIITLGGVLAVWWLKCLDCGFVVSEFELQSRYYVHFRTDAFEKTMNPLILPDMG